MHVSRLRWLVVLLIGSAWAPVGRASVVYDVRLDAAQTQMVDLAITVSGVTGDALEFRLPAWRPGRYVILDPATSVREVRAAAGDGRRLAVEKTSKATWRVATGGADTVRVDYRLYANAIGTRTRHVDDTHAFLSGSSVFLYTDEHRGEPVRVRVAAPDGWEIATGLEPDPADDTVLRAANYDVLVDSPLEIGRHDRIDFDVDGAPHAIVLWPPGIVHDRDRLVADFTAIVREHTAFFRRRPYARYVFLVHAGPGLGGGTEHLNSTIMQTSRAAIEGSRDGSSAYRRFLGLVSHEFFHTWNVKQFRPAGIHPYDYQRENYTTQLWIAEGTTSYYDDLTLVRAGLMTQARYEEMLGSAIHGLRTRPGARIQSVEASSFDAWIKHFRPGPDDVNATVSFYRKGALVSLVLDMEIRRRTGNARSLDDVLRTLDVRFPLDGPGYTPEDFRTVCTDVAGADLEAFFALYVTGTEPLPLEAALETVGLELHFEATDRADDEGAEDDEDRTDGDEDGRDAAPVPDRAELGLRVRDDDGRTIVRSVPSDGPAYSAGLHVDDEIIALDGHRVRAGDLDDRLLLYAPGTVVRLHVLRRDALRTFDVTLVPRPDGRWRVRKMEETTPARDAAHASWIGTAVQDL